MEKTPLSMRKHIALFGKTNAGKSSLFNALLGHRVSIVSELCGTTTDPVLKAMELIPYGPVTLIDTAGLGDDSPLGEKRMERSREILSRADLVLWVRDVNETETEKEDFGAIPVIRVYTKCDIADKNTLNELRARETDAAFIGEYSQAELSRLQEKMVEELRKQERDDETLLGNIVEAGSTVLLVVPIDGAAPKGRLILPQVQTIRDCLDNGIKAVCVTPDELEAALAELSRIDLVVTDSQVFGEVSRVVPQEIPLTSFSMLLANRKGNMKQFLEGARAVESLEDGDKILMLEACTHTTTHEDIGRVKIPSLIKKVTGKNPEFTHFSGCGLPDGLEHFKLVVRCGGCMVNKRAVLTELERLKQMNIPVTNYGVILAYLNGILDRASQVFLDK